MLFVANVPVCRYEPAIAHPGAQYGCGGCVARADDVVGEVGGVGRKEGAKGWVGLTEREEVASGEVGEDVEEEFGGDGEEVG